MSNLLNEINVMKFLTDYKRGVVISEQSENNLDEQKLATLTTSNCISEFQSWVKNTKKDSKIIKYESPTIFGKGSTYAFTKYGLEYGKKVISKGDVKKFQDWVINKAKNSQILGSYGADGVWGPKTEAAWIKYGPEYFRNKCPLMAVSKTTPSKTTKDTKDKKKCVKRTVKGFENINNCLADSTKSVVLGKSSVPDCATFVNAYSDKVSFVGDAWFSHDLDASGQRKFSVYTKVSDKAKKLAQKIFNVIWSKGGWEKASNMVSYIKSLQEMLIPNQSSLAGNLAIGDIVGIYYPNSSHHVDAFYESAIGINGNGRTMTKGYIKRDGSGKFMKGKDGFPVMGDAWKGGRIWSSNTHVGIVGDIKNGVPIIFHNIGGTVYADPLGKLKGGGKIMWIKGT